MKKIKMSEIRFGELKKISKKINERCVTLYDVETDCFFNLDNVNRVAKLMGGLEEKLIPLTYEGKRFATQFCKLSDILHSFSVLAMRVASFKYLTWDIITESYRSVISVRRYLDNMKKAHDEYIEWEKNYTGLL